MTDRSSTPAQVRRTRAVVLTAAAATLGGVVWTLHGMSFDRGPGGGPSNLDRLWPFWIASALAWTALTVLALHLRRHPGPALAAGVWGERPFGGNRRFLIGGLVILAVAAAARVIVVVTHDPALSDDVYRYVFDGGNGAAGVNPYVVRPVDRFAAGASDGPTERWASEAAVARRVNNPELFTIYLPGSQWFFAATARFFTADAANPVTTARVFRSVFVATELAACGLLLVALRRRRAAPWWLALYAWHPLPLAEIAGSGHQDALGLPLLVAALLLAEHTMRRVWPWTIALAGAALVKPIVVPGVVFLLRGRPWRAWLVSGLIGVAVCAVVAAPLLLGEGGEPLENLRATGQRFGLKWAHFGSVYAPVLTGIERITPDWGNDPQEQFARTICLVLLAGVVLAAWGMGRCPWQDYGLLFLAMVLLSPAAHPWYLLWALVLVPVARSPATWVASLTLPWGYAALADPVDWAVSPWLMAAAYVPVYAALLIEAARPTRSEIPETT